MGMGVVGLGLDDGKVIGYEGGEIILLHLDRRDDRGGNVSAGVHPLGDYRKLK